MAGSTEIVTHYLRQDSNRVAKDLNRKSLLWDIAAKVTLVALFAILAASTALSILSIPSWGLFLIAVIAIPAIATALLFKVERILHLWSQQAQHLAAIEDSVATQLAKMNLPDDTSFITFCSQYSRYFRPTENLKPLVARLFYWQKMAEQISAQQNRAITKEFLDAKLECAKIFQLIKDPNQEIEIVRYKLPKEQKAGDLIRIEINQRNSSKTVTKKKAFLPIDSISNNSIPKLAEQLFNSGFRI
jgi:hypothetical protein